MICWYIWCFCSIYLYKVVQIKWNCMIRCVQTLDQSWIYDGSLQAVRSNTGSRVRDLGLNVNTCVRVCVCVTRLWACSMGLFNPPCPLFPSHEWYWADPDRPPLTHTKHEIMNEWIRLVMSCYHVFCSVCEVIAATHREARALQETLHGDQLQLRVTPLPPHLVQGAGVGLQRVQGAHGVLRREGKNNHTGYLLFDGTQ